MSKKTSITLIAIATLILGCAGAAFAQGNGTGKGQEKKKTIASVFKWPKSWKSDSKPNGNAKFNRYKGLSKKTGHSPEASRYRVSKALASMHFGLERAKTASQTSGTSRSIMGRNKS